MNSKPKLKPQVQKSKEPYKLAVILPSRGLVFSETLDELLNELDDFDYEIFWSHDRSLPACFNKPLDKALADPTVFAVLFCEDDMIIPKGILKKMFDQSYPVIGLDYPFKKDGDSTMLHDPDGNVIWSGTGFLLVAKPLLQNMSKPIFRTDTAWDMCIKEGHRLIMWPRKLTIVAYGLHDVYFGMILFSQGIPIHDMPITAGQRKLIALGKTGTNNGSHRIKELKHVGRDLVIKTVNEDHINKFKMVLGQVDRVEVLDRIPDFITYEDGQAIPKFKDQKYQIV